VIVTDLRATPVAIKDPPLRSAFGLHAPFALRTIVEIETDEGVIGISETYGGRAPLDAFAAMRSAIVGRDVRALTPLRTAIESRGADRPEGWAWEARRFGPAALFSAIEVACLDAIGKREGMRVCDLLGGAVRDWVDFAAYLFFKHDGDDPWGEVMTPEAVVGEAHAMRDRYGYRSLKLKGGVLEPDDEVRAIFALRDAFGAAVPLRLDPNAAWSHATSVRVAKALAGSLQYLEDPVPGIDGMAAVARETAVPLATNMCVTAFAHIPEAVAKRPVSIILSDHHLWGGLRATVELGRLCETFGFGLSMHSNSHLGISLAAMVHVAAAIPNLTYACDTHYPWQSEEVIVGGKLAIREGAVEVPRGPGLGVTLSRDALAALHEQYLRSGLVVRDDALEMRRIDPGWRPHVGNW
jgi:glucarate dehydratase